MSAVSGVRMFILVAEFNSEIFAFLPILFLSAWLSFSGEFGGEMANVCNKN